jgi:hypothetical protein
MGQREKFPAKSELIKAGAAVLASILFFQLRLAFFFFLVPLFLYGLGRDRNKTAAAAALVWLVMILQGMNLTRGVGDIGISRMLLLLIDLSYPTLLIAGVVGFFFLEGRALRRLAIITAAAGCLSIPVVLSAAANETLTGILREQIVAVTQILREPLSDSASFEASILMTELSPQVMVETTRNLFFRFYIAGYFMLLAFGYVFARGIRARFFGGESIDPSHYKVPENLIWGLLTALPVVALDLVMDIGWLAYPFWNGGAVLLLIFGFQGLGIIRYRMSRSPRLRRARFFIVMMYVFLFFMPVVNVIALLSIPLLGVSELWIRYREDL